MQRALRVIGGTHMRNLMRGGLAGWWAMFKLFLVAVRILIGAMLHIAQDEVSKRWQRLSRKGSRGSGPTQPAAPVT